MKRLFLTLLTLITMFSGKSQTIKDFDIHAIKATISDSTSDQFYPNLIERFKQIDSTLTADDYRLIYYGSAIQTDYSPYGHAENEDKFLELFKKEKYQKAIKVGETIIANNPVNLDVLLRMILCNHRLGQKEEAQKYAHMYFPLLGTIYNSGDGKSIETAYIVVKVADEYLILNDLELSVTKQALVGETDVLTIYKKNQKPKNGGKKIKTLYFNVSLPLESLNSMFE